MDVQDGYSVKYSHLEGILLQMLPKRKVRISTSELITKFYEKVKSRPFNDRAVIVGMMRNLMRKSDFNDEKWRICKTKRSGPRDISFWKEPR